MTSQSTNQTPLRIGTRASMLATTQTGLVADQIAARLGREIEIVPISTEGDRSTAPLATLGGTGVFVSALREALLDRRCDVAVHSLKDLPTAPAEGIALAAVPEREDPRDVLISRDGLTLGELPAGARIGSGSPRRIAQLEALGLGVEMVGIRGNVETRIGKIAAGEVDAVVLARAGLARLGKLDQITEVIDPIQMLPAPGQGALAVETRSDDPVTEELRRVLDHPATRAAVTAERVVLADLEAGCSAPVGALAEVVEGDHGEELWIRAVALAPDGGTSVRLSASGPVPDAVAVARGLAAEMIANGAADLIADHVGAPVLHQAPQAPQAQAAPPATRRQS